MFNDCISLKGQNKISGGRSDPHLTCGYSCYSFEKRYFKDEMSPRLYTLRGKVGGVPWVQIMENELECLGDRRGHDSHLPKKFLKKNIPSPSYPGYRVAIWLSLLGNS